jgi:hypothetical protein
MKRALELAPKLMFRLLHEQWSYIIPMKVMGWTQRNLTQNDPYQAFQDAWLTKGDDRLHCVTFTVIKPAFAEFMKQRGERLPRPAVVKNQMEALLGPCLREKRIGHQKFNGCFLGWLMRDTEDESDAAVRARGMAVDQ